MYPYLLFLLHCALVSERKIKLRLVIARCSAVVLMTLACGAPSNLYAQSNDSTKAQIQTLQKQLDALQSQMTQIQGEITKLSASFHNAAAPTKTEAASGTIAQEPGKTSDA